ncbi:C-terminal binding protein, partial [Corallococcus exiguus]|nr:C-terminal binding protein [Corallococcus exiguus]
MVDLIFHPDVQFEGPADIEKAVYGTDAAIHISASHDLGRIPDEIWAKAAAVVCYHEIDISGPTLDRLPMCRVVVRAGVGFDNIDLEAAARRGIAVCNTPDYGTMDVADHAIALT